MEADLHSHVAFYLTGKRLSSQLDAIDTLKLRPALFSGYRDLTGLRYDFPLILVDKADQGEFVVTLSGVIDDILNKIARGNDAERIRKHVLRLEQAIRVKVAQGANGALTTLWDQAAEPLAKADKLVAESLSRARVNLKTDGEVIDCDASMPYRLFGHAWENTQRKRALKFGETIHRLVFKLSDIIKADFVNSDAGKSADVLKATFGNGPMDAFDFESMSRLLTKATPKRALSENRRKRVQSLLASLQSQQFIPVLGDDGKTLNAPYPFVFENCTAALDAYRERLPKAIELAKAVAMANLEIKGEYNEAKHDPIFESFGENGLDASEQSHFPDYLVRQNINSLNATEHSTLNKILSAELPIKVLVQSDDVIEESSIEKGHLAFALRGRQLASTALGMGGAFILQSPASNLYALHPSIQSGLDFEGPALFSVFSGASQHTENLPPYLVGAAALESRIFPAFTFDPSAGQNWASRFSLETNPEADLDWPIHEFSYEDEAHQSVSENLPFTLIDFAACDSRYARHFARIPRRYWNENMMPLAQSLTRNGREQVENLPYLLMVDTDNTLQKIIPDEKMIREARRCRTLWNSLQELGGIHNSHADNLLAKERAALEAAAAAAQTTASPAAVTLEVANAVSATAAPVEQDEAPEKSPDEAYIETPRCSTCNECVQLNGKMFAYDDNRQAYIADINAGTYAQLVEAAENCQVSIIHPGKPRNSNEPELEELIKRAEAFI